MIGAILFTDNTDPASKFMYHRFAGRAIAEHSATAYLRAEQIQRVIMVLPQSERKNVSGTSFQSSLISKDRIDISKKLDVEFFIENTDMISFIHHIATDYALDHIVMGNINSGLMPQWLINDIIYFYYKNNKAITTCNNIVDSFDEYFKISIMPFWHLARLASHSEDRTLAPLHALPLFENSGESSIISCKHQLAMTDLAQIDFLDSIYSEILRGADINDIIKEINDK